MLRSLAFLVSLLATFFGLSGLVLANHDWVTAGDFGPDTAFLTQLAEDREAMCLNGATEPIDPISAHSCAVRLGVWREDLNKDGAYELFVHIEQIGFCGTSGCDLDLFEQHGGEWTLLTRARGGPPDIYEDSASEWPILIFSNYSGRIWKETDDGGEYVWFCVSDRCRSERG